MTKYYCDMCKKEAWTKTVEYYKRSRFWTHKKEYSICKECSDEFDSFLEKKCNPSASAE